MTRTITTYRQFPRPPGAARIALEAACGAERRKDPSPTLMERREARKQNQQVNESQ